MPHPHFQLWLVSLCVDSCQSVSLGSPVVCLQSHPGHWPWETPGAATRVISKSPSTFAWHSAAASAFERSCPFLSFTVVSAGFYRGAQTYPLITRSSLPCLTDVIIALNRVIPSSLWSSLLKCFFLTSIQAVHACQISFSETLLRWHTLQFKLFPFPFYYMKLVLE